MLDRRLIKAILYKKQEPIIKRKVRAISVTADSSGSAGTCHVCTADACPILLHDRVKNRTMVDCDTPTYPNMLSSRKKNIFSDFLLHNVLALVFTLYLYPISLSAVLHVLLRV